MSGLKLIGGNEIFKWYFLRVFITTIAIDQFLMLPKCFSFYLFIKGQLNWVIINLNRVH